MTLLLGAVRALNENGGCSGSGPAEGGVPSQIGPRCFGSWSRAPVGRSRHSNVHTELGRWAPVTATAEANVGRDATRLSVRRPGARSGAAGVASSHRQSSPQQVWPWEILFTLRLRDSEAVWFPGPSKTSYNPSRILRHAKGTRSCLCDRREVAADELLNRRRLPSSRPNVNSPPPSTPQHPQHEPVQPTPEIDKGLVVVERHFVCRRFRDTPVQPACAANYRFSSRGRLTPRLRRPLLGEASVGRRAVDSRREICERVAGSELARLLLGETERPDLVAAVSPVLA
jgi:hypothetical protein